MTTNTEIEERWIEAWNNLFANRTGAIGLGIDRANNNAELGYQLELARSKLLT